MKIKKRKIKYKEPKFFGYPEDNWARLGGWHGKKRSYGRRGGHDFRSRAERRNADDLRDKDD